MRIYATDSVNKKSGYIFGVIASMLITTGIGLFFAAFSDNAICNTLILAEAIVLSIILAILEKRTTARQIFKAGLVIALALWIMLDFTGIRRAMLNCINSFIVYANEAFGKDYVEFGVAKAQTGDFVLLFSVLVSLMVMLVQYFVNKRNLAALSVLVFVFVISALLLKVAGISIILAFTVIGWAGCWSRCSASGARSVIYIIVTMAMFFGIGAFVLNQIGFGGFSVLDDLQDDSAQLMYKLRYGEDTLPKGDLFKADTMLSGDDETLRLTFDKPEAMYLKGFTGGSFAGNKWIEYKKDTYLGEWSGMLDYFKINAFDAGKIYNKYALSDLVEDEYNSVTVENIGAYRKYVYLPFTVAKLDGKAYSHRDLYTKSSGFFGEKKYSFTNVMLSQKPEKLSASKTDAEFLKEENIYRAFVLDTYLDIDEKTRNEINEIFYKDFDMNSDAVGVYTITTRIRSILKLITEYTEQPEEPADKDFIAWFLSEYKKGNSPYYATAAVMAFRAAGIPARYAEGYYVSDTDVQNLELTKKNTLLLSTNNSHAWVEIYRDAMGWISVEVTPGFYVEDEDEMDVIDISHGIVETGGGDSGASEQYTGSLSMYSPEKASDPDERPNSGLRIMFVLICLAIIFTMVIYIRYIVLAYIKNKRIYGDDTANYTLMYLCEIMLSDGIYTNPDNTQIIRRELLDRYEAFKPQEFDRVMSLVSRSNYGGVKLKEHELRTIRIFIEKLSAEVYKGKSFAKKLVLRYVKII